MNAYMNHSLRFHLCSIQVSAGDYFTEVKSYDDVLCAFKTKEAMVLACRIICCMAEPPSKLYPKAAAKFKKMELEKEKPSGSGNGNKA